MSQVLKSKKCGDLQLMMTSKTAGFRQKVDSWFEKAGLSSNPGSCIVVPTTIARKNDGLLITFHLTRALPTQ